MRQRDWRLLFVPLAFVAVTSGVPGCAGPSDGPRDRLGAWLVTGPLGRLAGFLAELSVALWRLATRQPQRED